MKVISDLTFTKYQKTSHTKSYTSKTKQDISLHPPQTRTWFEISLLHKQFSVDQLVTAEPINILRTATVSTQLLRLCHNANDNLIFIDLKLGLMLLPRQKWHQFVVSPYENEKIIKFCHCRHKLLDSIFAQTYDPCRKKIRLQGSQAS